MSHSRTGQPGWSLHYIDDSSITSTVVRSELFDETTNPSSDELQTKRKAAGECLHCGDLLPMSAMGLGDCKRCNP